MKNGVTALTHPLGQCSMSHHMFLIIIIALTTKKKIKAYRLDIRVITLNIMSIMCIMYFFRYG